MVVHFKSTKMGLCDPPWDIAHQAPGKNTGMGWHFLLKGIFNNSLIESRSPALQADSLSSEPPGKPKMGLLNI